MTGDDAGDALQARRREPRVPEDLRVVVRVEIDEPRRDQRSVGVEHPIAAEVAAELGDLAVDHPHVDGLRGPAGAVDHLPTLDHVLAGHASPWVVAARRAQELELVTRAPGPRQVLRSPSSSRPRGPRETRRSRSGHRRAAPRRGPVRDARRRPRRRSRGPGRSPARRGSGFRRCDGSGRTGHRRRPGRGRAPEFATRIDATAPDWPVSIVIHPSSTLCRAAFSTRLPTRRSRSDRSPITTAGSSVRSMSSARARCVELEASRPRRGRAPRDRSARRPGSRSRCARARASCR